MCLNVLSPLYYNIRSIWNQVLVVPLRGTAQPLLGIETWAQTCLKVHTSSSNHVLYIGHLTESLHWFKCSHFWWGAQGLLLKRKSCGVWIVAMKYRHNNVVNIREYLEPDLVNTIYLLVSGGRLPACHVEPRARPSPSALVSISICSIHLNLFLTATCFTRLTTSTWSATCWSRMWRRRRST